MTPGKAHGIVLKLNRIPEDRLAVLQENWVKVWPVARCVPTVALLPFCTIGPYTYSNVLPLSCRRTSKLVSVLSHGGGLGAPTVMHARHSTLKMRLGALRLT